MDDVHNEAVGIPRGSPEGRAVSVPRGSPEGRAVSVPRGSPEGRAVSVSRGFNCYAEQALGATRLTLEEQGKLLQKKYDTTPPSHRDCRFCGKPALLKCYCLECFNAALYRCRNNSRGATVLLSVGEASEGAILIVENGYVSLLSRGGALQLLMGVQQFAIRDYAIEETDHAVVTSHIHILLDAKQVVPVLKAGRYLFYIRGRHLCRSIMSRERCASNKEESETSERAASEKASEKASELAVNWKIQKNGRLTVCEYCYPCALVRFTDSNENEIAQQKEQIALLQKRIAELEGQRRAPKTFYRSRGH